MDEAYKDLAYSVIERAVIDYVILYREYHAFTSSVARQHELRDKMVVIEDFLLHHEIALMLIKNPEQFLKDVRSIARMEVKYHDYYRSFK